VGTADELNEQAHGGVASNLSVAKSLFSAAGVDGVDTTEPNRSQESITSDRRRIIPDTALASPRRPRDRRWPCPTNADVAPSMAAAPILEVRHPHRILR
jgi:hypothetical protein